MALKPLTEQQAALITKATPEQIRVAGQAFAETVQTVVWIVGLCSALIAILAAKDSPLQVAPILRNGLVVALAGAVLAGVAQRLIRQVAQEKHNTILLQFRSHASAFLFEFVEAPELQEFWTAAEIREQMLRLWPEVQVPQATDDIAVWRKAYQHVNESSVKYHKTRETMFQTMIGAFEGKSAEEAAAAFAQKSPENVAFEVVRAATRSLHKWQLAAGILYWVTSLLFAAAVVALAASVVAQSRPVAPAATGPVTAKP